MQHNKEPYTELDMMKLRAGWPILSSPIPTEPGAPSTVRKRAQLVCAALARWLQFVAGTLESYATRPQNG